MSAFLTETLAQNLSVVFFSESEYLFKNFQKYLDPHGIELVWRKSTVRELDRFLEEEVSENWYKMVWFDHVEDLSLDKAKKFLSIVQARKTMSYVLMHQPFKIQSPKALHTKGQTFSEVFTYLSQRSPYTSFLTYRDVIQSRLFSATVAQITGSIRKKEFESSVDAYGFIDEQEVFQELSSLMLSPRGGQRKVVFAAPQHSKKEVQKHLESQFRREFHEEFLVKEADEVIFPQEFKVHPVSSRVSMEEVVEFIIHESRDDVEKKAEQVSSQFLPKPNIPKPSSPKPQKPVVEKKVEKRVEELPIQDKVQRLSDKIHHRSPQPMLEPIASSTASQIQESDIRVNVLEKKSPTRRAVQIPSISSPNITRSKLVLQKLYSKGIVEERPEVKKVASQPTYSRHVIQHVQQKQIEPTTQHEQKKLLEDKIAHIFQIQKPKTKLLESGKKNHSQQLMAQLFGQKKIMTKKQKKQRLAVLFLLSMFLGASMLMGAFFGTQVYLQQTLAQAVSQQGSQDQVEEALISRTAFLSNALNKQTSLYSMLLGESTFSDTLELVEVSQQVSTLHQRLDEFQVMSHTAIAQILGVEEGSPFKTLTPFVGKVEDMYKDLSLLEAQIKEQDKDTFLNRNLTEDEQKKLSASILKIRKELLIAQQLIDLSPQIFAQDSKSVYAVVMQDSQELRATGGFIDGIALVHFENGVLIHTQFYTPQEIDKALGGLVTPPEEVKKYLGEDQWFLRDANWSPDTPQTGKQIEMFIEKGLNTQVDGVITLNTFSLQELLSLVGPLEIEQFGNEIVNEKNLQERAHAHAKDSILEKDSPDKKSYYLSVLEAFMKNIETLDKEKIPQLIELSSRLMKQSEMQIVFDDASAETVFATLGWAGDIMSPPCPNQLVEDQCLIGRVYQVDSNVGVNKVNYFIKKKVEHTVDIQKTKTTHLRTVSYENASLSSGWPGGVYKNYIRFYLPRKTILKSILVDGKPISPDRLSQYEEKASMVVGAYVEILPQTTSKVVIEYEESALQKPASYAFFNQKQPGTANTPTTVAMKYHDELIPTLIAPEAQIEGDEIVFTFFGGEHSFAGVKFK